MLKKVGIKNFKSFKNQTEIDLSKTNYNFLSQNVNKDGILKGCIFVGPNASGKSSVVLSIKLLLDFLFKERNIKLGVLKSLLSEDESFSLTYSFVIDSQEVTYGFSINPDKPFIEESLFVDNKMMMQRMGTSAKSFIVNEQGVSYDESDVDKETLFLRTLFFNTKFTSNKTLKDWMEFLQNSVYINAFERNIVYYGKDYKDLELSSYLKGNGLSKINDFFKEFNFEQDIEYTNQGAGNVSALAGEESEKNIFFKRKGVEALIPFIEESLGNQNLLRMLPTFLHVINKSGMLLIDEFSSGFHNCLEALLVRYFFEKAKDSQMIFVSHSTNLLSNSLLRPDQEYAVEFNGKEGSSVIRFSKEKPRLAQNIEKMYVSGVFGGLPQFEENEDK
ncbi:MAG: AAA family ATPase [Spirochaetales bacterium]|nr:AAA family ATPase [Spirochaetales bacterium]MDY5915300.1 AAA family ATPase [Treponema sp.]